MVEHKPWEAGMVYAFVFITVFQALWAWHIVDA